MNSDNKKPDILRKRSLAELDDVIEELLERNPDFVEKINKIIDQKKDERTN